MTAAVVVMPVQQVHRRCQPGGRRLRVCRFAVHATSDSGCDMTIHTPSRVRAPARKPRSEEHTSELQSLMRISYAVFCLKKKKHTKIHHPPTHDHPHNNTRPTTKLNSKQHLYRVTTTKIHIINQLN